MLYNFIELYLGVGFPDVSVLLWTQLTFQVVPPEATDGSDYHRTLSS
jgi:hypothetical protein